MLFNVIQAAALLAAPGAAIWLARKSKLLGALGPVAVCYLMGMVAGNQHWVTLNGELSQKLGGGAVVLAIPLMLFSVDVPGWMRSARNTIVATFAAIIGVGIACTITGTLFTHRLPDAWKVAGGLAGVYCGGTANMVAVTKALNMPQEMFIMANASDIIMSGLYFMFLISIAPKIIGLFLRIPKGTPIDLEDDAKSAAGVRWMHRFEGLGMAAVLAGIAVGVSQLFRQDMQDMVTIILVSTLGIAASFAPRVRNLHGTSATGEYVLFIFCAAIGSLADFSKLAQADPSIFLLTASTLTLCLIFQFTLFWIFRVDRDTALVASTGTIFSPPFVPAVAGRLNNKDALVSGVTIGLIGYASGTYLGIGVAWLIRWITAP